MSFSEIVGHEKQVEILRQGLANRRLHHAYVFAGPEGIGKRTLALALAQAIHCTELESDFCGQCGACRAIQNGNHADVRLLEPLSNKRDISIQQVRELEKALTLRSFSGRQKVAIIDPATLLNWPAQNALLKTLEEPPQGCVLILVASNIGGLLATVRSRAFGVSFAPLPRQIVIEFLVSKNKKTIEQAKFLAALAMGSLGTAVRIGNEKLIEKRRDWMKTLVSLTPGNYRAALNAAEALAGNREETLQFLDWAGLWYRDVLTFQVVHAPDEIVNLDMLSEIEQQSAQIGDDQLFSLVSNSREASRRVQRNLNRRMVLEDLLLEAVEKRS
jgi:DNA polymerase III subunit delta'